MVHFEELEGVAEKKLSTTKRVEVTPEYGAESDERAESIRREFIAYVEHLHQEGEHLIGKGSLAEVYPLEANANICVKVVNDSKEFGTISPLRVGARFYNSSHIEAQFLSDTQHISKEVGVPKPYYSVEYSIADPKGNMANISALAMERLDAVSIEEVVSGREDMPAAFNSKTFWAHLRDFVTDMHEKHIYHRDFHGGNIMIGKKDGRPYVIDFGAAAYATEYDAYERPVRGNVATLRFIEDFAGIEKVRTELEESRQ